jgi:hypothetical protein
LSFLKEKKQTHFSWTCRGEWGYMKRKIVCGKVKHSSYFLVKTGLKFVSSKNKIGISFCPAFYIAPFSSTHSEYKNLLKIWSQKLVRQKVVVKVVFVRILLHTIVYQKLSVSLWTDSNIRLPDYQTQNLKKKTVRSHTRV